MTLVSVLIGRNGIVIFADSQETIGNYAKKSVDKLTVCDLMGHPFRFAIAAATTDATYVAMLEQELSASLLALTTYSSAEIQKALSDTLAEFYRKHIWPQTTTAPLIEFLIAIQPLPSGNPQVLHISGTAVSFSSDHYKNIGIGAYLADYVFSLLLGGGESQSLLTMAAVYTAKQVHENVDGVGQVDRIVLLGNAGEYKELGASQIRQIQINCLPLGEVISHAFMVATDEDRSDTEVQAELDFIQEELKVMRSRNIPFWRSIRGVISRMAVMRKKRDEYSRSRRTGNG